MDYDPIMVPAPTFTAPRFCFNITLVDDLLEEDTEEFSINGLIPFTQLTVVFDPAMTTIRILDDELTLAPVTTMPETDPATTESDPTTDMITEDFTTTDSSSFTVSPSTTQGNSY